jgi:predicted amidophosphoribosyltransferase
MTQVLRGIGRQIGSRCDVRELIVQIEDTEPVHLHNDERLSPSQIREIYEIDESLTAPEPQDIGILDDVITAGSHFRAAKDLLQERFPKVRTVGIFVARRAPLPE